MNDRMFFASAFVVVAGMVGGSMLFGSSRPQCGPVGGADSDSNYSVVTVNGSGLCRMVAAGDVQLDLIDEQVLRVTTEPDTLSGDPRFNPHFKLAADLEVAYAGHRVTVSVTARPAGQNGAEALEVSYSTGKGGDSGWHKFDLADDWETYSFDYRVPRRLLKDSVAYDYLAVRPVVRLRPRSIEIKDVSFTRRELWAKE